MKHPIPKLVAACACAVLSAVGTSVIAHADNGCSSDEPFACDELDYLQLVTQYGITGDPTALLNAGYAACAVARPSDRSGPMDRDGARAAVLATGVVTSPENAENIVSVAAVQLC
ncbi:DUF732 domain-containing protein [Mycobacterium colombiense]|nr:DUF732 domain-containing protein [Mycobacterium colombiense]